MTHLLYKKECSSQDYDFPFDDLEIVEFSPRLKKLYFDGETSSCKNTLVRFMFGVYSRWKYKIIIVIDKKNNNEICHSSFLIPKIYKFPFLKKGDYEIGPCQTATLYRGKGIYPEVLKYILKTRGGGNVSTCYMVVSDENKPSIRGIEKAGFKNIGVVNKTKILKRYKYKLYE